MRTPEAISRNKVRFARGMGVSPMRGALHGRDARAAGFSLQAIFAAFLLLVSGVPPIRTVAAGDRPAGAFATPQRIPWTTSRILGSPEPPPPYRTERMFPKLTFHNPLDIEFAQGLNRVFVAEQGG